MPSYQKRVTEQSKVKYNPVSREFEDTENEEFDGEIDDINEAVTELTGTVSELSTQQGVIGDRVSHLETTVGNTQSGLVKDVSDNSSAISGLQGAVSTQSTAISGLQSTVGNSSSGLVKKVNDNTSAISGLSTTVGNASSGLVKKVNDIASDVSGFDSRIEDLEVVNFRLYVEKMRTMWLRQAPSSNTNRVVIEWGSGATDAEDCRLILSGNITTETYFGKTIVSGTLVKDTSFANPENLEFLSGVLGGYAGNASTSYQPKYIPVPFYIANDLKIYFELPQLATGDFWGVTTGRFTGAIVTL